MSKCIFQDTLSDSDVPDCNAETEDDATVEPGKSGDSLSDSNGQQYPLKSSKWEKEEGCS